MAHANYYSEYAYGNEQDLDVIERYLSENGLYAVNDDVFVVKRQVVNGKKETYHAYVCDDKEWHPMTGDQIAEEIYFNKNFTSNGVLIPAQGLTLPQVLQTIVARIGASGGGDPIELDPEVVQPSAKITINNKDYPDEVGNTIEVNYTFEFDEGNYQYGPSPTGVEIEELLITNGVETKSTMEDTFSEQILTEDDIVLTVSLQTSKGLIPITNYGNGAREYQIQAKQEEIVSEPIRGARYSFFGAVDNLDELNSDYIRALPITSKENEIFCDIPIDNAKRLIIASNKDLDKVLLASAFDVEITPLFTKLDTPVKVEGANGFEPIDYNIWIYSPGRLDKSEQYKIYLS